MPDARNATAADFDQAAQRSANAFWVFLIVSGVTYYFAGWWAAIPSALAILGVVRSISSTRYAQQLRCGTYRIPNPNNGAPDGDARNQST
jgi:hypothetical protein